MKIRTITYRKINKNKYNLAKWAWYFNNTTCCIEILYSNSSFTGSMLNMPRFFTVHASDVITLSIASITIKVFNLIRCHSSQPALLNPQPVLLQTQSI